MSRTLILMRHAKAEPAGLGQSDHARHLAPRGHAEARAMGQWLATQGVVPDVVLCSDALRTRQTADGVLQALPAGVGLIHDRSLYDADAGDILALLGKAPAGKVMVVAHNPGIALLAHLLAAHPPGSPAFDSYPPAATTVLGFDDAAWCGIGRGKVLGFTTPALLSQSDE